MKRTYVAIGLLSFVLGGVLCELVHEKRVVQKNITAQLSAGDLMDKITILHNKIDHLSDKNKKRNCEFELQALQTTKQLSLTDSPQLSELTTQLLQVNKQLWDIEDNIRAKEAKKEFDEQFIQLARAVYCTNRKRHDLKREINLLTGSSIIEEKQYTEFA